MLRMVCTVALVALAMVGLALGYLIRGRSLRAGCGGHASAADGTARHNQCPTCGSERPGGPSCGNSRG
ncbi:MAG: hypothetical protein JXR94_09675 [Candidatus Hydrogenedentes bacterium]|nr:hypothetical protein [Candidatus Hydrogenedentota bacterium]